MRVPMFVRKLYVRGRRALGYFSAENWPTVDDEPQTSISAKRVQHYGFVSEMPDDGQIVVVAINGGENNLAAVGEVVPDEPAIESAEVLLWAKSGQRVLLNKDGDVVVIPKPGRKVLLGSDTGTDPVVLKSELNAKLSTLRTWLNAHTHPVSGAVASASTPAIASLAVTASPNVEAKT